MLIEAFILGRENGILHQVRHLIDRHHRASFFAELTDQDAIGGVDAQGNLGLVLGQRLDRWQLWIGQHQNEAAQGKPHQAQSGQHHQWVGDPAK